MGAISRTGSRICSGSNQTKIPQDPNSPYFRYIAENVRRGRF